MGPGHCERLNYSRTSSHKMCFRSFSKVCMFWAEIRLSGTNSERRRYVSMNNVSITDTHDFLCSSRSMDLVTSPKAESIF